MGTVDDWRYILSRAPEGRGACRDQPAKITSQGLMARRRGATFAGADQCISAKSDLMGPSLPDILGPMSSPRVVFFYPLCSGTFV